MTDYENYNIIDVLEVPYSEEQRIDFIIRNNHQHGYLIHEDEVTGNIQALAPNENYKEQLERERIAKLHVTPLDFIYMLEDLGVSYNALKNLMELYPEVEKQLRFCNHVYRGNPLLDQFADTFGITSEQLDEAFKNKCDK